VLKRDSNTSKDVSAIGNAERQHKQSTGGATPPPHNKRNSQIRWAHEASEESSFSGHTSANLPCGFFYHLVACEPSELEIKYQNKAAAESRYASKYGSSGAVKDKRRICGGARRDYSSRGRRKGSRGIGIYHTKLQRCPVTPVDKGTRGTQGRKMLIRIKFVQQGKKEYNPDQG
jgi:hypothetical protein